MRREEFKFLMFDLVQKRRGYRFPGIIVSRYYTRKGLPRYVVECTAKGVEGCQHIFAGEHLQRRRK
jgi:hypothetical protein